MIPFKYVSGILLQYPTQCDCFRLIVFTRHGLLAKLHVILKNQYGIAGRHGVTSGKTEIAEYLGRDGIYLESYGFYTRMGCLGWKEYPIHPA